MISSQKLPFTYVRSTFCALTDALLPAAPSNYEHDLGVHDYVIYALDHFISIQKQLDQIVVPLSYPTAELLDNAATQLVNHNMIQPHPQPLFPDGQMFSCLSRIDRIRVLSALENIELDIFLLPVPYKNNAGFIKHIADALNRFSMFGYYSEWPGYGSTRLYPPPYRQLEFFPWGWQQSRYPGVVYGYRDFRGFLLTMGRNEGNE